MGQLQGRQGSDTRLPWQSYATCPPKSPPATGATAQPLRLSGEDSPCRLSKPRLGIWAAQPGGFRSPPLSEADGWR